MCSFWLQDVLELGGFYTFFQSPVACKLLTYDKEKKLTRIDAFIYGSRGVAQSDDPKFNFDQIRKSDLKKCYNPLSEPRFEHKKAQSDDPKTYGPPLNKCEETLRKK